MGSLADLDVNALIASEGGIDQACAVIAARRLKEVGRDLIVSAYDFAAPAEGPSALWMATAGTDYILYPRSASPGERERLIVEQLRSVLAAPTEHDAVAGMLELFAESGIEPEVVRHIFR